MFFSHSAIMQLIIVAPPLLLGLTVHEVAHGYVALRFGDPTARLAGRLTLNPLRHLDLVGTLAFFLFKIGWAKPVPVNPGYLRNPHRDMLWVALAGPVSNLALALVSALGARLIDVSAAMLFSGPVLAAIFNPLYLLLVASVQVNLLLCVFNFLPIPPLDGGRILTSLLPPDMVRTYQRFEPYGFFLVLILGLTGAFSYVVWPIFSLSRLLLGH